eukprot:snap_masked-scaffold_9-processed-gene-5.29-mRNA-1 protein AED:1.00 eAED:1.00 QI:0/-1/0/0/-1/1/1/0/452
MKGSKQVLLICLDHVTGKNSNNGNIQIKTEASLHIYGFNENLPQFAKIPDQKGSYSCSTFIKTRNKIITAKVGKKDIETLSVKNAKDAIKLKPESASFTADFITALTSSSEGNFVFAGTKNGSIYSWLLNSSTENSSENYSPLLAILKPHYQRINKILLTPNSSNLISISEDGLVKFHLVRELVNISQSNSHRIEALWEYEHNSQVTDAAFFSSEEDELFLVTVSLDKTARIIDIARKKTTRTLFFDNPLTSVASDQMSNWLFFGSNIGKVFSCNLKKEYSIKNINSENENSSRILQIIITPNNKQFLVVSKNKLEFWDIETKMCVKTQELKGSIKFILPIKPSTCPNFPGEILPLSKYKSESVKNLDAINDFDKIFNIKFDIPQKKEKEICYDFKTLLKNVLLEDNSNLYSINTQSNSNEKKIKKLEEELLYWKGVSNKLYDINVSSLVDN